MRKVYLTQVPHIAGPTCTDGLREMTGRPFLSGWPSGSSRRRRPSGKRTSYPQTTHRSCTPVYATPEPTNRQEIQEASIVDNFVEKGWAHGEQAVEKSGQVGIAAIGPRTRLVVHIRSPHATHTPGAQRPHAFRGLSTLSTVPTTSTTCTKETRSKSKRSGSIARKGGRRAATMWVMHIATELGNGGDLP